MNITGMYLSASDAGNEFELIVEDGRTLGLLVTDDGTVTLYDRTIGDDILTRTNINDLINHLLAQK